MSIAVEDRPPSYRNRWRPFAWRHRRMPHLAVAWSNFDESRNSCGLAWHQGDLFARGGAHPAAVNRVIRQPPLEKQVRRDPCRSPPLLCLYDPVGPSSMSSSCRRYQPWFHSPAAGGRCLMQDHGMVGAAIPPEAKRRIRQPLDWCPARAGMLRGPSSACSQLKRRRSAVSLSTPACARP